MGAFCTTEESQEGDFVRVETGADGRRYIVAGAAVASQSSTRFTQMTVATMRATAAILRFVTGATESDHVVQRSLSGITTEVSCYDDNEHQVHVRLRMPAPVN